MVTHACLIAAALVLTLQPAAQPAGAVQKLADYVEREWPGDSHQQNINVTALTLLSDAIEAAAKQRGLAGEALAGSVSQLRALIGHYRAGAPGTLEQSKRLRRTMIEASVIIDQLMDRAGARREPHDPRLDALARSAESFSEHALIRRQPDVLERFFAHAVESLKRLDTR